MDLPAFRGRAPAALVAATALALAAGGVPSLLRGGDLAASEDPNARWVGIYGWIQAGERLENGEHWPLALGCFIEAHRQAERLKESHPGYEAEMLAYRIPRLEERIGESDAKLESGDHEIMTKFLDFIDSYATGLEQRYESRLPEALDTLNAARILLDEIIHEKPEAYRDALATQHDLLHSSLVWLEGQVQFRERLRPPVYVGGSDEWGTTEFVKTADLPADGETILASASLFPFTPSPAPPVGAERVRGDDPVDSPSEEGDGTETTEDGGEVETDKSGMKPFRMSTRQETATDLLSIDES